MCLMGFVVGSGPAKRCMHILKRDPQMTSSISFGPPRRESEVAIDSLLPTVRRLRHIARARYRCGVARRASRGAGDATCCGATSATRDASGSAETSWFIDVSFGRER